MRAARILAAAVSILLIAAPASADERSATDPNDTTGSLDIARVGVAKLGPTEPLTIDVETHEGWGPRSLVRHANRVLVFFDTDEDGQRDFRARILRIGGRFVARLKGEDQSFEPLRVKKPNRRTVRLVIPGSSPMNPEGGDPRIRVLTRFIETHECDPASGSRPCIDRAPPGGVWL